MKYFLLIFSLSATYFCNAQTIRNDTVIVHTITFESADASPKSTLRKKYGVKKNSVGVGVLSWANGYVPFYYERYLFDFLSIKVGAGVTFRSFCNDLDQLIWADGEGSNTFDDYNSSAENVVESYYRYSYRKATLGYYFAVAPKFYPGSSAIDGFCLYPMLEFRQHNFSAQKALENISISYPSLSDNDSYSKISREKSYSQKEYQRCLDFTINIGGHYQTSSNFFVEWRLGAGIRKHWSSRLDVGFVGGSYINSTYEYSKLKPVFGFDLIMGGLF